MQFEPTKIPDVILIKPRVFGDERGFFMETWQAKKFAQAGLEYDFVQDNHSYSEQNILRGLHYQIKRPQGKLVRVVRGEVFDLALDLRQSSSSFGRWIGKYLSSENKHILWIPPGFAHGFYVTSQKADLIYKCTDFYSPQDERCIRWNDPVLAIDWPLMEKEPLVSSKDAAGDFFREAECYD